MSPAVVSIESPETGFPRASGDEPSTIDLTKFGASFSPRERG